VQLCSLPQHCRIVCATLYPQPVLGCTPSTIFNSHPSPAVQMCPAHHHRTVGNRSAVLLTSYRHRAWGKQREKQTQGLLSTWYPEILGPRLWAGQTLCGSGNSPPSVRQVGYHRALVPSVGLLGPRAPGLVLLEFLLEPAGRPAWKTFASGCADRRGVGAWSSWG
jgi:hypothetical protein